MGDTKIEWAKNADGTKGKSWNPIRARRIVGGKVGWYCQKKSLGCKNCYAERMNLRVNDDGEGIGNGVPYTVGALDVIEPFLDEKTLLEPLHWRKPTTVFVESMSDLFGSWVQDDWIDKVYAIEALCPQHTFIHVTKRPERRLQYLTFPDFYFKDEYGREVVYDGHKGPGTIWVNGSCWNWPLPNVRELVTVCNQEEADKYIPILLQTPAVCRGVSIEPLLGPINLASGFRIREGVKQDALYGSDGLRWVICGGESGPNARPMHPDWARSLRDQCQAAGVPFFFKQWGEWAVASFENGHFDQDMARNNAVWVAMDGTTHKPSSLGLDNPVGMFKAGKAKAGRLLDGREWNEFPETITPKGAQ